MRVEFFLRFRESSGLNISCIRVSKKTLTALGTRHEYIMSSMIKDLKDVATFKKGWRSYAFWGGMALAGAKIGHRIYKKCTRKSFENKVVLITGGAGGLGRQLAERFLKEKSVVIIWDINQEAGLKTVKDFKEQFKDDFEDGDVPIFFQEVNVTNVDQVNFYADDIEKEHGGVDVLINNAGILSKKTILSASDEQIKRVMDVNTTSHFWTVRAFVPKMIERDSGHVVCVSSCAALAGVAGLQVYCASKWAAFGFSESLRLQFTRDGSNVDTLIVMPYYMTGPMFEGVKSPLIPLLDPGYVADRIILSMKERDPELILPGWLRYLNYGVRFAIPGLSDQVQHSLQVTKSMDKVVDQDIKKE